MDIRSVTLSDDALMREVAEVVKRGTVTGRPHAAHFSVDSWIAGVRAPDSGERLSLFAAFADDAVVGVASLWVFLLDNTEKAWLEILVDPPARGGGVGSALLEQVIDTARAEGRTVLMTDAKLPSDEVAAHPYRAWAERRGFSLSNIEVVRQQVLPVAEETLDAWRDQVSEKAAGYRIDTYVNEFPDELAASLCVLLGQLVVDAPTGAVDFDEEEMSPTRLAERYATVAAMDWDLFETVAVTPEGVVAAQSTLAIPRDSADGHQWGTFVHREHRGHGLGLAVKTANLRAVQARCPHITRILTQNGETNDQMVAINEQLGFVPIEASAEFVRRF